MRQTSAVSRVAGILLAIGGILFLIGGILHPHSTAIASRPSILAMLHSHSWNYAHWLAFVSDVLIILALWLLLDEPWIEDSVTARVGARLTIIGGFFMMVEFAVELAAHGAMPALAAGAAPTMFNLFATMHVAGWPTFGAGFIVLIIGVPRTAPFVIRIIGIIGALAMGLAGVLVAGFFLTQFGWLFIGGILLGIWIIWAGIQIASGRKPPATMHSIEAGNSRVSMR